MNNNEIAFRKLRGFAFDPSLSLDLDTVSINEIEYKIPWEELEPGPVGEYIEVIDYDPTIMMPNSDESGVFYDSVDLDDPSILAQNGLTPSESNPKFHQQMVYAVAMTTIKNFEKALGRKILWSEGKGKEKYVEKLRIYPHALREANAYYSPDKKAILFGYFYSNPVEKQIHMPGSIVFTCLSHDIIAHEVTHAILDGINMYYNEATNPDMLAFHEAFADIVALFQHFTFSEVLEHQIARTKGNLDNQNLLGQLAQEFGRAIGSYGSLRSAIGFTDDENVWHRSVPDPNEYETVVEPHERGSILVAAIFDVFLRIYKKRISDLIRIATQGSGILPEGELHPDLVKRMSHEAAKTAKQILNICIRAIDYCPPIDLTFGAYLRAIITADFDVVKEDKYNYRLAFIEAFKNRGIYPINLKTLSVESLRYRKSEFRDTNVIKHIIKELENFTKDLIFEPDRESVFWITRNFITGQHQVSKRDYDKDNRGLHAKLREKIARKAEFENLMGIIFGKNFAKFGITPSSYESLKNEPSFWVTNLRVISKVSPEGHNINQVVFSIVQTARLNITSIDPLRYEAITDTNEDHIRFRGGATLVFDIDKIELKYVVSKPIFNENSSIHSRVLNEERLRKQILFQFDDEYSGITNVAKEFGIKPHSYFREPFAFLHSH